MSAEEVIIRIKDKMSQLTPEIRKAFLSLDKKGKGRITKRQFREVGDFFCVWSKIWNRMTAI